MTKKFRDVVGYGEATVTSPGVIDDVITEKVYRGDVIRNSRKLGNDEKVNNDLSVGNSISIVADAYAYEHFFAIRYIKWAGVLWTVSNVDVERPRLILRLGEVYNGPTGTAPSVP
jgi:hypothetical protein